MNSFPERLEISREHWHAISAHLAAWLPEEACGLAGGVLTAGTAQVRAVLPVENTLHSPVRFRMAPEAQLKAFYTLEERGLELMAIFHSHPTGPDHPSTTDITEFAYPGTLVLICIPEHGSGAWSARAFAIREGGYVEVPVEYPANIPPEIPVDHPPEQPNLP